MTRYKHQGGFVLLMALVIITFAMLLSASIARRSLHFATQANEAERRLQRRWGSLSGQRCLLNRADAIFEQSDQKLLSAGNLPKCQLSYRFQLGGVAYEVVLADEDAKVNLNTILITNGAASLRRVVRRLASGHLDSPKALALSRFPPHAGPTRMRPFRSWGQVFGGEQGPSSPANGIRTATTYLTLWGSGRLHLKRASDTAVRTACEGWLDAKSIERLMDLRQHADWGVATVVNRLQPRERDRDRLVQLLAEESTCYSLWIVSGGPPNPRHEFHITETVSARRPAASVVTARGGRTKPLEKTRQQTHFVW